MNKALFDREQQLKQERNRANQWRKERGYPLFPEFDDGMPGDHLMPMVLLSMNTGLRQGELFNLTWDMVDIIERSIIISGEITKNNNSRYLPLNNEAFKIIQQLHERNVSKEGLVFPRVC